MSRRFAQIGLTFVALTLAGCAEEECPSGDEMVQLTASASDVDFMMDKYEASRFDATATSQGSGNETACSLPDVMPWTKVSYSKARSACSAAGKRLCTREEWRLACESLGAGRPFPYGNSYDSAACNGANASSSTATTGSHPACTTLHGVMDLSGNAREWTASTSELSAGLAGGAFTSSSLELDCASIVATDKPKAQVVGIGDGFRCCK